MRMNKRLVSVVIALALCFTMMAGVVSAETYENLTYTVSGGKITITACSDAATGALEIPAEIDGKPVTAIGAGAFSGCTGLTSVKINAGVTTIGEGAFSDCTGLVEVSLPSGVTTIGEGAFYGCSALTTVDLPNTLAKVADYTFYGCTSLASVSVPASVSEVGEFAFAGCAGLTSATVSGNIGIGAFVGCEALEEVTLSNVTSIGNETFAGCVSLAAVDLPDSVTELGAAAFAECTDLATLDLGKVANIGSAAFTGCTSLTSVSIPENAAIGAGAFDYCTSLSTITIPDSVTAIGKDAVNETAYYNTAANWKNNVLYIGNHLIVAKNENLGDVTVNQGVVSVADYAFANCTSLTSVSFPGAAPVFNTNSFANTTATIRYTCQDAGWAALQGNNYGGTLTWNGGHTYTATANPDGTTTYTCSICGHSYLDAEIAEFVAQIGDVKYATVKEALEAAKAGDEVVLIADAYEMDNYLTIGEDITLNIGTYNLTAKSVVGLNGSKLNAGRYSATGDYGKVFVAKNRLILSEQAPTSTASNGAINDVIPMWDPEQNCYVLANMRMTDAGKPTFDLEKKSIAMEFSYTAGGSANTAFLKDGTSDNAMSIVIRLQWESENGVAYQDFVYKNEYVAELAQAGSGYFTFELVGYDILNIDLDTFTIKGMVLCDSGVIVSGTEFGYEG